MTPIERLLELLDKTRRRPLKVKSDYARKYADIVGMAASLNLLTTRIGKSTYTGTWFITTTGLTWLNEKELDE